ncbi:MAG: GDP-mannose 4,6-dehydratase [Candidatus Eisenbacteria bacterium]
MKTLPWKRALVTGVSGFTGSWLAERLADAGAEVHGFDLPGAGRRNLAALPDLVQLHEGDLTDAAAAAAMVRRIRPEAVFHLAGRIGEQDLGALLEANVVGTESLLRALAVEGKGELRVVLVTGSASEYGPVAEDRLPIGEEEPFRPANLYGVSKAAQSLAAAVVARRWNLPLVRTRAFNITGPRESLALVGASFAEQIARIEKGERKPEIRVGPLGAARDFTDVRDVARAYLDAAREPAATGGIFNVCSGRAVTIREVLDRLVALSGVKVEIVPNPAFAGRDDRSVIIGDGTRAKETFGYEPAIPLEDSLRDLLGYWRERIRES